VVAKILFTTATPADVPYLEGSPEWTADRHVTVGGNFESKDPGWKFWRNFRKDRIGDVAADIVFPSDNDLIVDTWSMDDFGTPKLELAGKPCDFGTSSSVWHCNYFRQDRSIDYLAGVFKVALD
jgi:hypothetical protein